MSRKNDPSKMNGVEQRLAWLQRSKKTAPMLNEQARISLRDMTLAERQKQIANLLELAERFRKPRIDNGLVIMRERLARIFER